MEVYEVIRLMAAIIASQMVKDMEPTDPDSREFVVKESVALAKELYNKV